MSNIVELQEKGYFELTASSRAAGKRVISYSQISMFNTCPYKWETKYVRGIKYDEESIYLLYGNAMHRVLQYYIQTIFKESAKAADNLNFDELLLNEIKSEFNNEIKKNGNKEFTTKDELREFYLDGLDTLNYIRKNRSLYFSTREYDLIGIEYPLLIELTNKVSLIGFLDVVLKNKQTGKIKIIDIKTSTRGWKDDKKKDLLTNSQLLIYKQLYAKKYFLSVDDIEVEFMILKQKLWENSDFKQKKIQLHSPASGKPSLNKSNVLLENFLKIFNDDGEINLNYVFKKNVGDHCKWCEYKKHKICDMKN